MTTKQRHIVALGGGGFSMEPRNSLLDDYTLRLTGKRKPRVCFLPTASGDAALYIARFERAFPASRARASILRLFKREHKTLRTFISRQDVVYVGGGNTANALAVWRAHGVDRLLRSAWRAGTVMTGVSAGMLCWFQASVTDSFGPLAALHDGLGLLKGSACPHYDGEAQRRPTYRSLVRRGFPAGVAADDSAALHYVNTRLHRAICSVRGKSAYRLRLADGKVEETPIRTEYLG